MDRKRTSGSVVFLTLLVAIVGCHKPHKYEANVEISRVSVVRRDANGRALTTDVEFSYFECPGTQVENVRGGEEFSKCISKLPVGAKVSVKLEHRWTDEGHYVWEVNQLADCPRLPDPNDEASFATVRECEDWTVNGATVGFECQIKPKKELLKKCPWFAKH